MTKSVKETAWNIYTFN